MTVGNLKEIIKSLPDEMEVFVGCEGYYNFDFENNKPFDEYDDTFAFVYNKKLIIDDSNYEGFLHHRYENYFRRNFYPESFKNFKNMVLKGEIV